MKINWKILNVLFGLFLGIVSTLLAVTQVYPNWYKLDGYIYAELEASTTWTQYGRVEEGMYRGNPKPFTSANGSLATIQKVDSGLFYKNNKDLNAYPHFFRKTDNPNAFRNDIEGEIILFVSEKLALQQYCSDPPLKCGQRGIITLTKVQ
ncbi:hypothetical protein GTQ34_16345 [Muricauda sp. JGD-17]|uniref:Uncharacterized protein n=1 Tax=Flagellimonas ochracea TaxID=2696472 RepID=A0A964TFP3_9FLAO|nr:hypothetical protein [Allomuricauda ochracea]NAY93483.1 hypothetical protein [Allomuricauda ochracea]